jgi:hypothetical protein
MSNVQFIVEEIRTRKRPLKISLAVISALRGSEKQACPAEPGRLHSLRALPAALSATQNTRMAVELCSLHTRNKKEPAHARVEDDTFGAAVQGSEHEQHKETNDKR